MNVALEWYRGLAMTERLRSHRPGGVRVSEAELDRERGSRRLAKWRSQPPFNFRTLFQQRLDQWGVTESEFLDLLSERNRSASAIRLEPPSWVVEVSAALADQSKAPYSPPSTASQESPDAAQECFLELVRPLIDRAIGRLRQGLKSLAASSSGVPTEPDDLECLFRSLLPGRLLPILLRTMALELNVARLQGQLSGDTPKERFVSFIARIQQPQVRLESFREYPVLWRQCVIELDSWLDCSLEFLRRWCDDWQTIRAVFVAGQDPGPLVQVKAHAGDSHRGGRSVWILQCRSGFKLVYKPRSLAIDQHFQEMLIWLNERGLSAPFQPIKVLSRDTHGWEEFVPHQSCSCHDEVARFYERAGGYLALLHSLAACDFHHQNLIAAGEHPVLIDLEALFHTSALESDPKQADEFAGRSFSESVLASGLLPVPLAGGHDGDLFDLSGLGADAGHKLPIHRPGWKDTGTDQMQFERGHAVVASSDHQPKLNCNPVNPLDYLDSLVGGFQQVYCLLEKHRDDLLAPGGLLDQFASDEIRLVLRSTSHYGELLQEGTHPDVLRDALDRDRLFDRLWDEVKDRPLLAQLISAEIEDLWRGDIPLFTTRAGSRDLWAGPGRLFKDLLSETGLEYSRRRLRNFGPEDLQRQLWFLRSSLTTLATDSRPPASAKRRSFGAESTTTVSRDRLVEAACAIGDRLAATAHHGADDVAWIGLTTYRRVQWVLAPLGLDLYDGLPGVALFFAYLGAITGHDRYTDLARATFKTVRRQLSLEHRRNGFAEIGGFVGWGGIIYMLTHLGVLWAEPALLAEAHEVLEVLPDRIQKDKKLDLVSGAAGCISGLLCFQTCKPSPQVLHLASRCGDHLLSHATPMPHGLGWIPSFPNRGPLTGFSHGAAGISLSLLRLAEQTGEYRFKTAALGGIEYERSLFAAEAANWPDLRGAGPATKGGEASSFAVAWCNGAPGIGLARLLCRRYLDDPSLLGEAEVALRTTLDQGFGSNHSLCHGDLGNLELLREYAQAFPTPRWSAELDRLVTDIYSSIIRDGLLCGNPMAVESPGLMTGIAGIGYALLRCAEPDRVPSILSLAPPTDKRFMSGPRSSPHPQSIVLSS